MSSQRLTFWQAWVLLVVEGAKGGRSFEVTGLLGFFVVVKLGPPQAASCPGQSVGPLLLKILECGCCGGALTRGPVQFRRIQ
jgi:hypothetical protein